MSNGEENNVWILYYYKNYIYSDYCSTDEFYSDYIIYFLTFISIIFQFSKSNPSFKKKCQKNIAKPKSFNNHKNLSANHIFKMTVRLNSIFSGT